MSMKLMVYPMPERHCDVTSKLFHYQLSSIYKQKVLVYSLLANDSYNAT